MSFMGRWRRLGLLGMSLLLFSACSGLRAPAPPRPAASPADLMRAQAAIATLQRLNRGLESFKGTGKIEIWQAGQRPFNSGAAWIGAGTVKLRIALRNPFSGQPLITIASNGEWLYLIDHHNRRNPFYRTSASGTALKKFTHIALSPKDLILLLSGRVPIGEFQTAVVSAQGSGQAMALTLETQARKVGQRVYFDQKGALDRLEMFDPAGGLSYAVEFGDRRKVEGFDIPHRLEVSNNQGAGFRLTMDRYWINGVVDPLIFVLQPPDAVFPPARENETGR